MTTDHECATVAIHAHTLASFTREFQKRRVPSLGNDAFGVVAVAAADDAVAGVVCLRMNEELRASVCTTI